MLGVLYFVIGLISAWFIYGRAKTFTQEKWEPPLLAFITVFMWPFMLGVWLISEYPLKKE